MHIKKVHTFTTINQLTLNTKTIQGSNACGQKINSVKTTLKYNFSYIKSRWYRSNWYLSLISFETNKINCTKWTLWMLYLRSWWLGNPLWHKYKDFVTILHGSNKSNQQSHRLWWLPMIQWILRGYTQIRN